MIRKRLAAGIRAAVLAAVLGAVMGGTAARIPAASLFRIIALYPLSSRTSDPLK